MIFTVKIRDNKEFTRLYRRGAYEVGSLVVVYAQKSKDGVSRIGITTSKKIGNAVIRNRARRVIRSAYTQIESSVPKGWSFVFVARSRTAGAKSYEVAQELSVLIEKATSRVQRNRAAGASGNDKKSAAEGHSVL